MKSFYEVMHEVSFDWGKADIGKIFYEKGAANKLKSLRCSGCIYREPYNDSAFCTCKELFDFDRSLGRTLIKHDLGCRFYEERKGEA